jgi:DNA-binding NarL/FixJ family response regulator
MGGDGRPADLRVCVVTDDPLLRAGTVAQLGAGVALVGEHAVDDGTIAVLVTETFDDAEELRLDTIRARADVAGVLVPVTLDDARLARAITAGVRAIVWRRDAAAGTLRAALEAVARGGGDLPPDLTGKLLDRVRRSRPPQRTGFERRGLLSARELDVLRLIADGYDTHEIAIRLAYSERTIKTILHDVTTRLHLRNRSHAVAFLIRRGLL